MGRRRLTGVAALSAATLATLSTVVPAAASEVCAICGELPPPGILVAANKLDDAAMDKWLGLAAFDKIGELGFPGATEDTFLKFAGK